MQPIPRRENPYDLFREWYEEAWEAEAKYPDGVSLATVDPQGMPSVRTVLMKEWDERGFVFYTNFNSRKGRELLTARKAGLCFYWKSLERQLRIVGPVEPVSEEQADAYFASRPRESRLGAWASHQSEEITDRSVLVARLEEVRARYEGTDVPRPPHWSGMRVMPVEIEFWQEGEFRLHDRVVYTLEEGRWVSRVLSP